MAVAVQFRSPRTVMARLRRDTLPVLAPPPLRIFATGTVFLTHALVLHAHPQPGTVARAQSVHTARGGAAAHVLALLAQLAATVPAAGDIEPMLIASLGGSTDALRLRDALEAAGVRTKYCKIWPGLGVPSAWVVHARDTDARTVINHNPLPDVSHDDFIALLGPVLAPENYVGFSAPQPPPAPPPPREQSPSPNTLAPSSAPRPSMSSRPATAPSASTPPSYGVPTPNPHSPAPFDWLHLEGRSVRTTIANLVGIDGLARERKWRAHCVISVDLGRRAREGVQVVCPPPPPSRSRSHNTPHSSSRTPTSSFSPPPLLPRSLRPNQGNQGNQAPPQLRPPAPARSCSPSRATHPRTPSSCSTPAATALPSSASPPASTSKARAGPPRVRIPTPMLTTPTVTATVIAAPRTGRGTASRACARARISGRGARRTGRLRRAGVRIRSGGARVRVWVRVRVRVRLGGRIVGYRVASRFIRWTTTMMMTKRRRSRGVSMRVGMAMAMAMAMDDRHHNQRNACRRKRSWTRKGRTRRLWRA